MGRKKNVVPTLARHKASGQGRVRIGGKDFYCGPYGSRECQQRYADLIREHAAGVAVESLPGRREAVRQGEGLLVAELVADYISRRILARYSRGGELMPSGQNELAILREFREAVGPLPVFDVCGPTLLGVRSLMVRRGLKRGTVNKRISSVKRMFRWGLANDLVPPDVAAKVNAVDALVKGDDGVADDGKVKPVANSVVDATLPYLNRQIRAVVKLQSLTAARGGEILSMRPMDIDRSHEIWWYTPRTHKTQHHGKDRVIPLGRQAQEIIKPFLNRAEDAFLFSPRDSEIESGRKPSAKVKDHYTSAAYLQRVVRAAAKAGVGRWHPHQLRHAAATAIRKSHGIETASIMLGHSSVSMTELYAEKNRGLAEKVAAEIG